MVDTGESAEMMFGLKTAGLHSKTDQPSSPFWTSALVQLPPIRVSRGPSTHLAMVVPPAILEAKRPLEGTDVTGNPIYRGRNPDPGCPWNPSRHLAGSS